MLIRRRNWNRKAMTAASVELDDLYENAWHSVAKPPRRRSGIRREMSLSMRAPSVAPRGADVVGSLKVCRGGTTVGETREEGENYNFRVHAVHSFFMKHFYSAKQMKNKKGTA